MSLAVAMPGQLTILDFTCSVIRQQSPSAAKEDFEIALACISLTNYLYDQYNYV